MNNVYLSLLLFCVGKDITLPDGRIVRSIDVMGETSAVSSGINEN